MIIMAGGRGERFWPVSRERHRSNSYPFAGEAIRSCNRQSNRVLPMVPLKISLSSPTRCRLLQVAEAIAEAPEREHHCGTGRAGYLRGGNVGRRGRSSGLTTAVMAVLPADHVIPEEKKFQQVLADALTWRAAGR